MKGGAGSQPINSIWATQGDVSREDFDEYRDMVGKQFREARRIVVKSMQKSASLARRHARQENARARKLEIDQDIDAAARWGRVRKEIRKPKLIRDKDFERKARQIDLDNDGGSADKVFLSAGFLRDPPLYDNLPDKLRQMTVELLLRRSSIACILEDWKAMDACSRQAHEFARDFNWEPFVAQCAYWTGIARYKLKDWIGAYDKFEEADKTAGYYIAREDVLSWLSQTLKKLEETPVPSSGLSAARGEQAPYFTPLGTVFEEQENFPFLVPETQNPAEGNLDKSKHPPQKEDQSMQVVDTSLPADTSGTYTSQRVIPAAVTLPGIVEPPRIRTPRLYDPPPRSDSDLHSQMDGRKPQPSNDSTMIEAILGDQKRPEDVPLPPSPPLTISPNNNSVTLRPRQTQTASLQPNTSPHTPNSIERQQLKSALLDSLRIQDERTEAAIRSVKAAASPRVLSAKSASARYSHAPWSRPLSWINTNGAPFQRSPSVLNANWVDGVGRGRGGRMPRLATRTMDSAVFTAEGLPLRRGQGVSWLDWWTMQEGDTGKKKKEGEGDEVEQEDSGLEENEDMEEGLFYASLDVGDEGSEGVGEGPSVRNVQVMVGRMRRYEMEQEQESEGERW
ncbi:MAG: hypothetical protein Q9166_005560 [cf. Caloplaca sp. 2 TL-2023]